MDNLDQILDELTDRIYVVVHYQMDTVLDMSIRMSARDVFSAWDKLPPVDHPDGGFHIAHYLTPMKVERQIYVKYGGYSIGGDGRAYKTLS